MTTSEARNKDHLRSAMQSSTVFSQTNHKEGQAPAMDIESRGIGELQIVEEVSGHKRTKNIIISVDTVNALSICHNKSY